MGIASAHDVWTNALELVDANRAIAPGTNAARMSPLSPWATRGRLAHIEYDGDVFGGANRVGPVTGAEALRCAPVKKGRALLHSLVASRPLVAISTDPTGADVQLRGEDAPTWLYHTDTEISPQQRMADMLDDHLLYEATVLAVRRGTGAELGGRGAILDAVHLPYEGWRITDDGHMEVVGPDGDWWEVDPDAVIYIPGPSAGLTVEAQDEVRQWRAIARNIAIRLNSPAPSIILQDPDTGAAPEDDEIEELVAAAAAARRSPNGGVMYVANLTPTVVNNNDDSGLFIASRNALRIDFANHLNFPVAVLDGSPATASLTYSTKAGARDELADLSLDYWTTPIVRALSQDAVVPRGTRVRFDFSDLYAPTNAPTGAATQD